VAPERTIVIEDTPTGTRAGVAAGAKVYGLTTLNASRTMLAAGATLTFAHMRELPDLLGLKE
jgi:beta-phosphoglucomutase-like phosphatase (HAD superfamily)